MLERTPMLQRLLALVLPLLLLAAGTALLVRMGEVEPSPEALQMDAEVAEVDPELVVVGNSLSAGVDHAGLGAALGGDFQRSIRISEAGTGPPVWYVLLKNRVFEPGYVPRIVVLPVMLQSLMRPAGPVNRDNELSAIERHRQAFEPIIEGRGSRLPVQLLQAKARRAEWRASLFDAVKYAAATPFVDAPEVSTATDEALARVFSDDNTDHRLKKRVIPVAGFDREADDSGALSVADTFVPDLVDLIDDAGSKLLVVRVPVTTWTERPDIVDPALEAELARYLARRGHGYLDMSRAGFTDADFADHIHVNAKGQEQLTAAVAERLRQVDLDQGELPVDRPVVQPASFERVGRFEVPVDKTVQVPKTPCGWLATLPAALKLPSPQELRDAGHLAPLVELVHGDGQRFETVVGREIHTSACLATAAAVARGFKFTLPPGAEAPPEDLRFTARSFPHKGGGAERNRDVYYLPPGTTARWTWDQPWNADEHGPFRVVAIAAPLAKGPAPQLTVGDKALAMTRVGSMYGGVVTAAPATDAWTVEVHAPEDGGWVRLRALVLGEGDRAAALIGREMVEPRTIERLVGSDQQQVEVSFGPQVPRLPAWYDPTRPDSLPGPLHPSSRLSPVQEGESGWVFDPERVVFENHKGVRHWLLPDDVLTFTLPDVRTEAPDGLDRLTVAGIATGRVRGPFPVLVEVEQGQRTLGRAKKPIRAFNEPVTIELRKPVLEGKGPVRIRLSSTAEGPLLQVRSLALSGPSVWSLLTREVVP